jgi:hypothetical protein
VLYQKDPEAHIMAGPCLGFGSHFVTDASCRMGQPTSAFLSKARLDISQSVSCYLMISKILLLVKQIRPRTTQIYDLRTSVSVLF